MGKEEFGRLLKKLRDEKGLTQNELVYRLREYPYNYDRYSKSDISKWENAKTRPPADVRESIIDILREANDSLAEIRDKNSQSHPRNLLPEEVKKLEHHQESIRCVANQLQTELQLPALEDLVLYASFEVGFHTVKNVPDDLKPSFVWHMNQEKKIELLCPVEVEDNSSQALADFNLHLESSKFSAISETLGTRREIGGYLISLVNQFVSSINDCVAEQTGTIVGNRSDPLDQLLDSFTRSICLKAINKARGSVETIDFVYDQDEITDKNAYSLYADFMPIGILPYKKLEIWKDIHKEMMLRFEDSKITIKIIETSSKIQELDAYLVKELKRFNRIIPIPGHCEVCKGSLA